MEIDYNNPLKKEDINIIRVLDTGTTKDVVFEIEGKYYRQSYRSTGQTGFKFIWKYPSKHVALRLSEHMSRKLIYGPHDTDKTEDGSFIEYSLSKLPQMKRGYSDQEWHPVEIKICSDKDYWYKDKIGERYHVRFKDFNGEHIQGAYVDVKENGNDALLGDMFFLDDLIQEEPGERLPSSGIILENHMKRMNGEQEEELEIGQRIAFQMERSRIVVSFDDGILRLYKSSHEGDEQIVVHPEASNVIRVK